MEIVNLRRCGGKAVYCVSADSVPCLIEFKIDYDYPELEKLVQEIITSRGVFITEDTLPLEKRLAYCFKTLCYIAYLYFSIDRKIEDVIHAIKINEKLYLDGSQGIELTHIDFESVMNPEMFNQIDEVTFDPSQMLRVIDL